MQASHDREPTPQRRLGKAAVVKEGDVVADVVDGHRIQAQLRGREPTEIALESIGLQLCQ